MEFKKNTRYHTALPFIVIISLAYSFQISRSNKATSQVQYSETNRPTVCPKCLTEFVSTSSGILEYQYAVGYAGFWKGGEGQELQKIWDQNKNLLHPKSVQFLAQN